LGWFDGAFFASRDNGLVPPAASCRALFAARRILRFIHIFRAITGFRAASAALTMQEFAALVARQAGATAIGHTQAKNA
jgi:hypothetical protein